MDDDSIIRDKMAATLSGRIATLMQSGEAEAAAWRAPGMAQVHNHLRLAAAVE